MFTTFITIPALLVLFILWKMFRIVPMREACIKERLGSFSGTLLPGFHFLIPFVDRIAYRHEMREQVMDVPDETLDNPADEVEALQLKAYLHQQIDELPESYKILVILRYQQELSYEEIASVLSLPLGTVKTGLFRAKAQLRQALTKLEGQPI